jgi:pimeloyl-ACP methyl ester carboxylesterase
LVGEASHLLGLDVLSDAIFGAPEHKLIPLEAERGAYLTDMTYKSISERPDKTIGYTRLKQYDGDMFSVWQNDKSGELTVTVAGTKLNFSNILEDVKIFFGKTDSKLTALDETLNTIEKEFPGKKYNLVGHSLGTAYCFSELPDHRENIDQLLLFNAASSPLQDPNVLTEFANQDAQYFINHGDIVSDALLQNMNAETLQNNVYLGPYRYAPWSAHSMSQWYPESIAESDKLPKQIVYEGLEDLAPDSAMNQDTPETQAANLS